MLACLVPSRSMVLNGFLFAIQVVMLLVAVPMAVISVSTSRRRHVQQGGLMAVSVVLIVLTTLGLILTLLVAAAADEPTDWLELCVPALTIVLCGVPIFRSVQAGRKRGQHSRGRTITAERR